MRRFIFALTVIAIVILGVGFWRGWFIVDRARVHDDAQTAIDKVKETGNNILKKDKAE